MDKIEPQHINVMYSGSGAAPFTLAIAREQILHYDFVDSKKSHVHRATRKKEAKGPSQLCRLLVRSFLTRFVRHAKMESLLTG